MATNNKLTHGMPSGERIFQSLSWSRIFLLLMDPKAVYLTDKRSPLKHTISVEPSPFLHKHLFFKIYVNVILAYHVQREISSPSVYRLVFYTHFSFCVRAT